MYVIVPLAGPDFLQSDGGLKALKPYKGEAQLAYLLESRSWAHAIKPEDYIFILFDDPRTRDFAREHLQLWYPGCRVVYLSNYTRGAALTALAGLSFIKDPEQPIIIDLGDIDYRADLDIGRAFSVDSDLGAIALTFESHAPIYSYLKRDEVGRVIEAAEKRVISDQASAGTYIFRSASRVLCAIGHALENEQSQTYNALFYVCPLFNGILAGGDAVNLEPVSNVVDVKVS